MILTSARDLRRSLFAVLFIVSVTTSLGLSSAVPIGNYEPDIQVRLNGALKEHLKAEVKISLAESLGNWFKDHPDTETALPIYVRNFQEAIGDAAKNSEEDEERATRADVEAGAQEVMRELVPTKFGFANLGAPAAGEASARKIPSTISDLLRLDADVRRQNEALKLRANQACATAVVVIAQSIKVQAASIPLLNNIVTEMINVAAERLGDRIAERVKDEGRKTVHGAADGPKNGRYKRGGVV
jgi:hypothetical protein